MTLGIAPITSEPLRIVVTPHVMTPNVAPLPPELGPQPVFKTGWRPAMGWTALATPFVDMVMQFVGVGQMDKITLVCTTVLGVATVIMRGIERIKGRA